MSRERADIAVIGAGIVGLCTAYALRERGVSVCVYERGVPGNAQSGGDSRIFRHAHDDPRLVALARDSRAIWRAWQERLGVELVSGDGVVALGEIATDRLDVVDRGGGAPVRRAAPDELAAWLPVLAGFDGPATIDEEGGGTRNRAAVDALAGQLGDGLVIDEVVAVRATGAQSVEIRAGGVTGRHACAVVCAGAGTAALVRPSDIVLPVRPGAHVRLTFPVRGTPPQRLACLQDGSGDFGETGIYAAPSPGNGAYGVGLSAWTDAREDGSLVDPAELDDHVRRVRAYVERALPGLEPEPVDVRHCHVTELPWGSDGLAIWRNGPILAIAGHNLFKNAPSLGRALAAAATGAPVPEEMRPEARLGAPG